MPIYTYRCENCGVQFERQQHFSDQPLTRCPECSKTALRKVYLPVGIVFKGSGFYATDNRSPSGSNRGASKNEGSEDKPASEKSSDKSSDTSSEKSSDKSSESSKD